MCCFEDLRPYLDALTPDEKASFRMTVDGIATGTDMITSTGISEVITASQIARSLTADFTEESEAAAAVFYTKRYFETLPLGQGLVATELQPADDFALLAGQAFVSAWDLSHDRSYLEKATVVLDFAAARSKYKYQMRILLVKVLRLLGSPSLALKHFRILDVKSVQFDTLSHVILSRATTFAVGHDPALSEEVASAQKWYKAGESEASEMPVRAFSYGNYSKIEDFAEFQERLSGSLSKQLLSLESVRMQAVVGSLDPVAGTKAVLDLARTLNGPDRSSDNRDFKTLPSLQPATQRQIREQTQMGPETRIAWLRAMVAIYVNFLEPSSSGAFEANLDLYTSELTSSESALLTFSGLARAALSTRLEAPEAETSALIFFKEQESRFIQAAEDTATLPWELLHIAEISLEGFCLLDLAVDQKIAEITAAKPTDHLNADHLMSHAYNVVDSRKTMAEALGSALHKRCSK
ncbi:N-terminal acetyltransferase B complex non-catalytic subunit, partial [Phenoliferia sp. Uapishka_3]